METSNFLNETALSTDETEPIVVVCAADNNYAMPLAVTIRSAMENFNSSRQLLWFVMDGGITKRNKNRILKSLKSEMFTSGQFEIRWLPKPEVFDNDVVLSDRLPSCQSLPNAAFYRLVLPEVLPKQFRKAIYIDCDIAINASLKKLWEINIEDYYLLAAKNINSHTISHPEAGLLNWRELGFSPDDKKFMSGVLVFNLEKWRANNMCTKALDYLEHNMHYIRWHDSDVLHAIVKNQWGAVDGKWNFYKGRPLTKEEVDSAFIIHYISPAKPWIAIEKTNENNLFFHYLRMTDWSGYKHTIPQRLWRRLKRENKKIRSKLR
ncbi:glycosyltransferase family 8 protein [Myxosarcina sp. GI1]|uniref:glycosyltransferase family 8 protein n=1 Tax=Myxosarcina sp. GI1 TaxID=1541065 RepID=UPI00068F6E4E|nr:glycosyltransferase family 8 protein [Myxosarcina sp. GI1]